MVRNQIVITGTVFVALFLIWYFGVSTGDILNKIQSGWGNSLILGGWVAFIVLIIAAAIILYSYLK